MKKLILILTLAGSQVATAYDSIELKVGTPVVQDVRHVSLGYHAGNDKKVKLECPAGMMVTGLGGEKSKTKTGYYRLNKFKILCRPYDNWAEYQAVSFGRVHPDRNLYEEDATWGAYGVLNSWACEYFDRGVWGGVAHYKQGTVGLKLESRKFVKNVNTVCKSYYQPSEKNDYWFKDPATRGNIFRTSRFEPEAERVTTLTCKGIRQVMTGVELDYKTFPLTGLVAVTGVRLVCAKLERK